jgi:hypothetical protein
MSKETNIWLHEGNTYEFGQDYLFSDNKVHWTYGALTDLDSGFDRVFCTVDKEWLYIKEVPASENMGTITPAPIELVDGAAYMFDLATQWVGFYVKERNSFFSGRSSGNKLAGVSECKNIRRMTVEKK